MEENETQKTRTLWVKYGALSKIAFVTDSVLVLGHDCYFLFYDTIKRTQLYYCANGPGKGDGIKCFSGHKLLPIFAFAELCLNPRVIIMGYPQFDHFIYLENGSSNGYLQIAFSHTEYLVTLTDLPTFNLIVWAWRTGEKLITTFSDFPHYNQLLLYATNTNSFAQISKFSVRNFKIWSLHVCGKHCTLDCTDLNLPLSKHKLCGICWTADNQLLVLDTAGNIYRRKQHEKRTDLLIKWPFMEGKHIPAFTHFKNNILLMGPSAELVKLKLNESTLVWESEWKILLEIPFYRIVYNEAINTIIAMASDGRLCTVNGNGSMEMLQKYSRGFSEFTLVWPTTEHMVTINKDLNILSMWKISTGEILAELQLMAPVICLRSSTVWPLVVLGHEDGTLAIVNCYDCLNPNILAMIHLMKKPIDAVRFSEDSHFLMAANCLQGDFFLLRGEPNVEWSVISFFQLKTQCISANVSSQTIQENLLKMYVHQVTSNKYATGDQMYILTLDLSKDQKGPKRNVAKLMYYYNKIEPDPNVSRKFYGVPYKSRTLHILGLDENEQQFSVQEVIKTEHQMRLYNIDIKPYQFLTFGFDGYIFIHNQERTKLIFKAIQHHRFNNGVFKVATDCCYRYVISEGADNTIVCIEILNPTNTHESDLQRKLHEQINSEEFRAKLNVRGVPGEGMYIITVGSNSEIAGDDVNEYLKTLSMEKVPTWFEIEEKKRLAQEAIQCATKREQILAEFKLIKDRIKEMLDENERADEMEKLPIHEFNLDEEWIETSQLKTNEKCARLDNYLQNYIKAVSNVTEKIKKQCWDTSVVKHQTIRGFYDTLEVQNFPIGQQTRIKHTQIESMKYMRDIEIFVNRNDILELWKPIDENALRKHVKREPQIYVESEADRLLKEVTYDDFISSDDSVDKETRFDEINRLKFGTTTHLYVNINQIPRYSQFENHTFFQFEQAFAAKEYYVLELRKWFNQKFDEVKSIKETALTEVNAKIARFRYILSELKNTEIIIDDPFIPMTEHPEKIVTVDPEEVSVTPYISPSQQAILDAEAAERERERLLMLKDDFRERALLKMMDGVLEIRWEDEIKKDVPVPLCMIEKDPKKYTEEDLREIAKYHERVKFIESERERYRKMLENEYGYLAEQFRDKIAKFNDRLADLYLLRLKVLSALMQERFYVANSKYKHMETHRHQQEEVEIRKEIADWFQTIEHTSSELAKMNQALIDLRANLEVIRNKDQQLEKNYRKDLPKISNALVEVYFKVLKRRPRYVIKSTSALLHYQLAKCIVSGHRPAGLPSESLEYLKSLDTLDTMVGVPNTVQEEHYDVIRKIRRVKIENELKLRGITLEIAEGESTIAFYNRKLAIKREMYDKALVNLRQLQQDRLQEKHNIQIQLVLKKGYVEIEQTGHIADFDEAILINRSQIEDLNRRIKMAGEIKLKTMTEDMIFRRSILQTEWLHKYKCMEIEDLENQLRLINKIKLYREVMDIIRTNQNLDLLSIDREEKLIRKRFEKTIDEQKEKLKDLNERIAAKRADNERLNERIRCLNIDVHELKETIDMDFKDVYEKERARRIKCLYKRSKLLKKIQEQHNEIVVLQTELELLRLRTYPTLKCKSFAI